MAADTREDRPRFLHLSESEFTRRSRALWARYRDCDLCSYDCRVDRTAGERGACDVDDTAVVSSYFPHFGEEDVLRGSNGSGTIFLANCNMGCVFCQNAETSHEAVGEPVSPSQIARMALELQDQGCHNINFVSPTHHAPHLVEALRIARNNGLSVPIVWNCGGYERAAVVRELEDLVDVYMPDVKWADDHAAAVYSKAPNYWTTVKASLREMHRQVGDLQVDGDGLATGGLLVRHLVMPGHVESAKSILSFIAEEISTETYVNVMAQYRPAYKATVDERYAAINRPVTPAEYREVVAHARSVGLSRLDVSEDSR